MTENLSSAPLSAPEATAKRPWYKKTWVVGVGAFMLGAVMATAGSAEADPKDSVEYKALATDLSETQEQLNDAQDDLTSAEDDLESAAAELEDTVGDLPAREKAVEDAEAALVAQQAAVKKATAAVKRAENALVKRERAVGIAERVIARNTIPGDGVFQVGVDMAPGVYKTAGSGDCYYAVLGDANGNNILSNNITSGPATVSVASGQFFESTRCDDWVLQR